MKIVIGAIAALIVLTLIGSLFVVGCERIDAGHSGIQVDLYGTSKGVQDVELVTGMVWYNRLTTAVYEFPTFIRTVKWEYKKDGDEVTDHSIHCTTSDGMALSFGVSFNYSVEPTHVTDIFKKYRIPIDEIQEQYLYTSVRNAYNGVAGRMTAEHIISNRNEYEDTVRKILFDQLTKEGFRAQQLTISGTISMPKSLQDAINSKITAVQNAQRAENEKQQTIAEAMKQIEAARGDSASSVIRARGSAEVNRLKSATLTPLIVQQQVVERWNGELPVYGAIPTLFRDVAK